MYVCLCLGVTSDTVTRTVVAGAATTKQVADACGAARSVAGAGGPYAPSSPPYRGLIRRRDNRYWVRYTPTAQAAVASNAPHSSTPTESTTPFSACTVDVHAARWLRR